ncbi:MAG: arginine--tRNA ligase [Spirochaetia bacterium]
MFLSKIKQEILASTTQTILEIFPQTAVTDQIVIESPKDYKLGDIAIPLFPLIKEQKLSPKDLAEKLSLALEKNLSAQKIHFVGAYLNIFLDRSHVLSQILCECIAQGSDFYTSRVLSGQRIMLEFSAPNTNKPLHLGHMRNNCLGESLSRILKKTGADVFKVNIINDRGVHICKSMLAYEKFGQGKTPESAGIKSDHFVGDFYVKYNEWEKEDPSIEIEPQKMLVGWEGGDSSILSLWKKMNDWAINGIHQTYQRTGISFDKLYFESLTYKLGRDIIIEGLERHIFFRADDNSVRLDLTEISHRDEEDEPQDKVFLRSDGTTVYISQDLGTAVERHKDYPFDRLIYVVANEQQRHFQVLFYALKKLGYAWAKNLYHLSYGMVNLPDGKMKSREGTVVDADKLIDTLSQMAKEEIDAKQRGDTVDHDAAEKIAIGAIHYYLLQVSAPKDMVFNAKESLSFNGNTGPYLQYTIARANSLLCKDMAQTALKQDFNPQILIHDEEWLLIKSLDEVHDVIIAAALEYAPYLLINKLYDIAKLFNKYYHDIPILSEENTQIVTARCQLVSAVNICLRTGLDLLNIPILEHM